MIYTIGYQNSTIADIQRVMDEKDIGLLIDVRSIPYSRFQDFNKNRLEEVFGERYSWLGKICGGKHGPAKPACIKKLIFLSSPPAGKNLLLMCMENHPCDCHRLYDISRRLMKKGIDVIHLFDGQEKTTAELYATIPSPSRGEGKGEGEKEELSEEVCDEK